MKLFTITMHIDAYSDTAKVSMWAKGVRGGTYTEAVLLENAPLETPEASKDPWVLLASAYRALAAERALRVREPDDLV